MDRLDVRTVAAGRRSAISAARLREVLSYDPETGRFTRKIDSRRGRAKAGDIAGSIECTGYAAIWVDGVKYLAHRLAWLYVTGEWPADLIDHINGFRADNRIGNLRQADNWTNQQNLGGPKGNNTSGFLGVSRSKARWKAEIRAFGVRKHIGTFDTPQEAHSAYLLAKKVLHVIGRSA